MLSVACRMPRAMSRACPCVAVDYQSVRRVQWSRRLDPECLLRYGSLCHASAWRLIVPPLAPICMASIMLVPACRSDGGGDEAAAGWWDLDEVVTACSGRLLEADVGRSLDAEGGLSRDADSGLRPPDSGLEPEPGRTTTPPPEDGRESESFLPAPQLACHVHKQVGHRRSHTDFGIFGDGCARVSHSSRMAFSSDSYASSSSNISSSYSTSDFPGDLPGVVLPLAVGFDGLLYERSAPVPDEESENELARSKVSSDAETGMQSRCSK